MAKATKTLKWESYDRPTLADLKSMAHFFTKAGCADNQKITITTHEDQRDGYSIIATVLVEDPQNSFNPHSSWSLRDG